METSCNQFRKDVVAFEFCFLTFSHGNPVQDKFRAAYILSKEPMCYKDVIVQYAFLSISYRSTTVL